MDTETKNDLLHTVEKLALILAMTLLTMYQPKTVEKIVGVAQEVAPIVSRASKGKWDIAGGF